MECGNSAFAYIFCSAVHLLVQEKYNITFKMQQNVENVCINGKYQLELMFAINALNYVFEVIISVRANQTQLMQELQKPDTEHSKQMSL